MTAYSTNERAAKLVGRREIASGTIIFDFPCELGYHCPVCEYDDATNSDVKDYDERLEWSEYNGFIWCRVCNKDYPSALCQTDIDKAISTYLDTVEEAIKLAQVGLL